MEQSLKGTAALVTGASRGVGRAIAERLAGDGATVAVTYNASKSGADEAVAAIEKAGGTAFAIQADLVDPATVFLASDDDAASDVGGLAESLGLAPIKLCGLMESGCSCSARENRWGRLIIQDLVKFG